VAAGALDPEIAAAIVRHVDPAAEVVDVVARTGGQLSAVFEVRCAERGVIVKVYADDWRWARAKEVHVYGLLARHGVGPAPVVLHTGDHAGRAFTVLSLVPGRPLAETDLDSAQHHRIYRRLGEILASLHGIRQDAYGYLGTHVLDPRPTNTAYMTGRFTERLREFDGFGGDPALRRAVEAHVAERVGLFAHCRAPVLCHNDFHDGNVLVAEGPKGWEVTGFVDVENAAAADPLVDLAKTDYYSIQGDEAKLAGLVEGYGPLPDGWRDRVALYRVFHALELWTWYASIGDTRFLADLADDVRRLVEA